MSCSLQYGKSPLYVAAENGHMDILNILITHGANVDTVAWVRNLYVHIYIYLCFKVVFRILSDGTILDDVHV